MCKRFALFFSRGKQYRRDFQFGAVLICRVHCGPGNGAGNEGVEPRHMHEGTGNRNCTFVHSRPGCSCSLCPYPSTGNGLTERAPEATVLPEPVGVSCAVMEQTGADIGKPGICRRCADPMKRRLPADPRLRLGWDNTVLTDGTMHQGQSYR
jgi:hypothetical protein